MSNYILNENGADRLLLEDGSGLLELEYLALGSSRPLPLRGYNVMYSNNIIRADPDQFDVLTAPYGWYAGGATVSANNAVDPDGWPLSDAITFPFGGTNITAYPDATLVAGQALIFELWIKGTAAVDFGFYDNVSGYQLVVINPTNTWTKYYITRTIGVGATDVRALFGFLSVGSTGPNQYARARVYFAPPTLNMDSTLALPIGGSVVFTNPEAIVSSAAMPLGGSVVFTNPEALASVAALLLGGSVVFSNLDTVVSTKGLPLGGTTVFSVKDAIASVKGLPFAGTSVFSVASQIASALGLPLSGSVVMALKDVIASVQALPLGGVVTMELGNLPRSMDSLQALPLSGVIELLETRMLQSVIALPLAGVSIFVFNGLTSGADTCVMVIDPTTYPSRMQGHEMVWDQSKWDETKWDAGTYREACVRLMFDGSSDVSLVN